MCVIIICLVSIDELRVVVVHDGVRPLVPPALTQELVLCAEQHGAAGAVRPLVSTVLRSSQESFLVESLDRSIHVASETPQAFQLSILWSAYNKVLFINSYFSIGLIK